MARTVLQVVVETNDDAYENTYGSRPDAEHADEVRENVVALLDARSPLKEWASGIEVLVINAEVSR